MDPAGPFVGSCVYETLQAMLVDRGGDFGGEGAAWEGGPEGVGGGLVIAGQNGDVGVFPGFLGLGVVGGVGGWVAAGVGSRRKPLSTRPAAPGLAGEQGYLSS